MTLPAAAERPERRGQLCDLWRGPGASCLKPTCHTPSAGARSILLATPLPSLYQDSLPRLSHVARHSSEHQVKTFWLLLPTAGRNHPGPYWAPSPHEGRGKRLDVERRNTKGKAAGQIPKTAQEGNGLCGITHIFNLFNLINHFIIFFNSWRLI